MTGKKAIAGAAIAIAAILCAGAATHEGGKNAVLVEEVYVVKPGDTLWGISETYLRKNTGTRRYILEYKEGIYENNPWLVERKGLIQPGDQLVLTYWKKGDTP
ncbi:LysM domain protein [Selenomonas sp. FOBRC6]|uniref:LysM peptidoglycan-binding domain-containing protein n=1 Tax=Selenomonas sp. FOBRC6 TaxID=936572 RepID=UPI000278290A|nr:LysM domain-containing protein [Selenomonas sp. FOBRC6]EJO22083.1 LysM domain protein [Selenomonas sp. FOBRC6]